LYPTIILSFFAIVVAMGQLTLESAINEFDNCSESQDSLCIDKFLKAISTTEFDSTQIIELMDFGTRLQRELARGKSKPIFDQAIVFAERIQNDKLISDGLERLASVEMYRGNLDQANALYLKARDKAIESKDRYTITKSKINLGHIFRRKGEIDSSAYFYRQGILDLEEENNQAKIGYPYMYLGILYGVNGQRQKSVDYFTTSYNYFKIAKDTSMSATVAVNTANSYMSLNQLDSSEYYLNEAIPQFEKLKDTRSLLNAESQLGRLYLYQSRWELSENLIKKATQKAIELDLKPQLIYNYRLLAEAYFAQDKYNQALENIFNALDICTAIGQNEERPQILKLISDIYLEMDEYENAYNYEKQRNQIEDSIFSEKKKLKVEELEAKFEAEKKEKEIAKLSAETVTAKLRKTQLLWAISIVSISLLSFIGFLIFKQRKNKQLFTKERDIQIGKRKTVELENKILLNEIELKNKELVSSALLISKKNSFLELLKQKVESKDEKVQRLIHHELASENEWQNFLNIFNKTHSSFVENLDKIHEPLSVTEKRLACLVKMNMSSKEIASVLNISYEGVKKGKYRLKKKLQIQDGMDLAGYLKLI